MQILHFAFRFVAVTVLPLLVASAGLAQQHGDTVIQRTDSKEDVYLAGGSVYALARVDGDVVAAGGSVSIENDVTGDVLAAGGNVTLRGRVDDDVRLAGGNVTISGIVGDDAIAAGGTVMIAPTATVRGRAWLAGASVEVHGKVGKGLKATGQKVVISGEITGDAEIAAQSIEIRADAVIAGNLRYRSPQETKIDGGARIAGTVTRDEASGYGEGKRLLAGAVRTGFYISMLLSAIAMYLLFPAASLNAAREIPDSPWKSAGLGLAVLAATPLAILMLFVTLIGAGLALLVLTIYLLLLLFGYLVGVLSLADIGWARLRKNIKPTRGWRVLSIAAAFVVLWIVCLIPFLGGLITFAVLIFGLGGLVLELTRRYRAARSAPA